MNKIGIIVVSYHNQHLTAQFVNQQLPKIASHTLVVVNVDSNYESSSELAEACGLCLVDENHSPVSTATKFLIYDHHNIGYAKGNNKGVKFLQSLGDFDYFLFSNDDIVIESENILNSLAQIFLTHPDVAAVGPQIVDIDGCQQNPTNNYISPMRKLRWKLFDFLNFHPKKILHTNKQKLREDYTYWVSGAFFMADAKKFLEVGGFDERTFLYYEEAILAERFLKKQYKEFFLPSVKVQHLDGGTTKKNNSMKQLMKINKQSSLIYYHHYRHVHPISLLIYRLFY